SWSTGAESASEPGPMLLTAIVRDPASRAAAPTRTAFRRGTGLVKGTPVSFRFTNLPQQMFALTNCCVNAFCSAAQYGPSEECVKGGRQRKQNRSPWLTMFMHVW